MLSPKRTKYRKHHRGHLRGKAQRGNKVVYGGFALRAVEPTWITARQIEAGRRVLTRFVRRGGNLWIRIFPDKPVTLRAAGSRMGSGKGAPSFWVAVVKPGRILYEIKGLPEKLAVRALKVASYKMPVRTKILRPNPS
uniref:Large ribosomal subunit protein uL16c n=1 Tax=Floydiella terrestris TaxID=51328 RepID=E2DSH5_FLOTE|nr:ribosomal protein L16 [Floydiella terrestris]ACZ58452.1 ribosomal protein L16 [Floydiella terrestris]